MRIPSWLGPKKQKSKPSEPRGPETSRQGETVAIDVTQRGNDIKLEGDGIDVHFAVEGIELPPRADANFAVWGLLAAAMGEGFNLQINRPIDPQVAANAKRLSRIWEMWLPNRYRSISVSGKGRWSRAPRTRLPCINLHSGGVDTTFAILKHSDPQQCKYALTIYGLDYRRDSDEEKFAKLIAKTDPLLEELNYQRIIVRTNANLNPGPGYLTHGLTLASCLFLLSDLFEGGTIPADATDVQDMVTFPWGTNHITNQYFAGSDFAVQSICADISRTEKLAAIAANRIAVPFLSVCRKENSFPANCGICHKCIRTKAMFLAATGSVPGIFIDPTFDERLLSSLDPTGRERPHLFDLYGYAKDRGLVDAIPGLSRLVEECRRMEPKQRRLGKTEQGG